MRVLFVNANRSLSHGGVERWMIDAARGLCARGHTCAVVGRPGMAWLRAAERDGIPVRPDIHGTWLARVVRIRSAMRAFRPDVVVAKGKKAVRMAAFGRSTGAPGRVAIFFGLAHELEPQRWFDRVTWRWIDAGIVVAHGAADWYAARGFGPREKLHVLWKGIDLAAFDTARADPAATRAALGLADGDVAIGMVGRLAWQKGIDDFLAAAARVHAAVPRARFFVVGGGRDAAAVAEAAAKLDGAVTLLGPRDDVPALLGAFDVVVQSSRREAMAQTTLEAMAAVRAVVSTRTIGADEAIEDGRSGLLVDVGDVDGIVDRVRALVTDAPRRRALGDAARARIAAHFTDAQMLDRCEEVLARIAAR